MSSPEEGEILEAIVKPLDTSPLSRKSMFCASLSLSGSVWVDSHCQVHEEDAEAVASGVFSFDEIIDQIESRQDQDNDETK